MSTETMSARELLLSRESWLRVAEIDGDIFLRIDGRYSAGLGTDMAEHWTRVLKEVLHHESEKQPILMPLPASFHPQCVVCLLDGDTEPAATIAWGIPVCDNWQHVADGLRMGKAQPI